MARQSAAGLKTQYLRYAVIPAVLLAVVAVAILWILAGIRAQVSERVANSVQTEMDVAVIADSDALRRVVQEQFLVNRVPENLLKSTSLASIRRLLAPAMKFYQFPDFAI